MPWDKSRGASRLTVLGLPASIKSLLVKQKARTRKPFSRQICEALIRDWQRQGLMAASPPVCDDWPQVYVPSQSPVPPVVSAPVPPAQQNYVPPQRQLSRWQKVL
jgi:hypothetical protein